MAQRRMLSQKISISEQVQGLDIKNRLLFTWIIVHADDLGLLPYSPNVIKAIVFPMSPEYTIVDIEKGMNKIVIADLVEIFEYEKQKFYKFKKFFSHQTLKKDRYPQTILDIQNEGTPKEMWDKLINIIYVEDVGFQMEDNGNQLDTEVKRSEEKICATHPPIEPDKKPKKKKETSPEEKQLHKDVVELIDCFQKLYKKSMGKELIMTSWARYIKQAKPFVKKLGLSRMKILCDAYFIQFEDKFIKQNAWSIGIFLTDNIINSLNNKYS